MGLLENLMGGRRRKSKTPKRTGKRRRKSKTPKRTVRRRRKR